MEHDAHVCCNLLELEGFAELFLVKTLSGLSILYDLGTLGELHRNVEELSRNNVHCS